jgi:fumarate reductase subunit D
MSESFFNQDKKDDKFSSEGRIPELENDEFDTRPSEDKRMMAVMAYIPFLCFIPLLKMRDDQYVYFHARQGLVLFFLEIIAFIFSFPHLSQLFWTAIIIGCIGAAVAGIMFAVQGKAHQIPIIGELASRLKL